MGLFNSVLLGVDFGLDHCVCYYTQDLLVVPQNKKTNDLESSQESVESSKCQMEVK